MVRIRRIRPVDVNNPFTTGFQPFDFNPDGSPCDMRFYYERDRLGEYEVYVVDSGLAIGGLLCLKVEQDYLYVSRIGVDAPLQRRGFGRRLHQFALRKAVAYGKTRMILLAHQGVIPFFEGLGWRVLNRYDDPHWGVGCARMIFDVTRF